MRTDDLLRKLTWIGEINDDNKQNARLVVTEELTQLLYEHARVVVFINDPLARGTERVILQALSTGNEHCWKTHEMQRIFSLSISAEASSSKGLLPDLVLRTRVNAGSASKWHRWPQRTEVQI